ncbi:MAG: tyrosine-type recombinase/integrase [Oscillospiraceae bacterium]|nr:tyrosine-type recombinase/integrase [Oscillospiraceae bacterium]
MVRYSILRKRAENQSHGNSDQGWGSYKARCSTSENGSCASTNPNLERHSHAACPSSWQCAGRCVILTGTEKPMEPRTLQKRFKRYLELHDLQHISFHGLRHTFATRSIDEGFDPKTLSEVLGHSNVKTTLQLYVHPSLSQKRRLVEGVSGFLPAAI